MWNMKTRQQTLKFGKPMEFMIWSRHSAAFLVWEWDRMDERDEIVIVGFCACVHCDTLAAFHKRAQFSLVAIRSCVAIAC